MRETRYQFGAVFFFVLLHAGILAAWWTPPTVHWLVWLAATYSIRMFGVTAGYHRYFGHRSYKLGRAAQFAIAFLAQTSAQKGILWWAAHHRLHHRESDRERDVHSPSRRGFWWAHVGWVLSNDFDEYDSRSVAEFLRFPELRWLDRHHWVPTVVLGDRGLDWRLAGVPLGLRDFHGGLVPLHVCDQFDGALMGYPPLRYVR